MLMKCQKCNHENQLGSIFCRGCGSKLEVEQFRPKVEHASNGFNVGSIVSKIISFVIFMAFASLISMLLYPDDLSDYANISGEPAIKAAKAKCEAMQKKAEQGFGDDSYTLTAQEATYLYNEVLAKASTTTATSGGTAPAVTPATPDTSIEKIVFNIDSIGFVHIILKTKLFGQIPSSFEMKGSIVNAQKKEEGKTAITFNAVEYKIGHMPVMFIDNFVIDKFKPALESKKIEQLLKAISKVEINDAKNAFMVKF